MKSDKRGRIGGKIKYLPFAPGIPWNTTRGGGIRPKLTVNIWKDVLQNRNAVVAVHGGLIESYVSLIYLEAINYLAPEKKIYWNGNQQMNQLVWLNGLASISPIDVKSILTEYPAPIFLDRQNYFYFNVLNNYLVYRTLSGKFSFKNRKPIIRQMLDNTTLDWNDFYLPQIRKNELPNDLKEWIRIIRFNMNQPYVCLFPDRDVTIHQKSCLGWNPSQIRAFGALLKQMGIRLFVFTKNGQHYYNSAVDILSPKLNQIVYLLKNTKAVLSESIDYLLMSGMISDATLVGRPDSNRFDLEKNLKVINRKPTIYISKELTPSLVLDFLVNGVV